MEDLSEVKILSVPHSPVPHLNIVVKRVETDGGRWKAWLKDSPGLWEMGETWSSAVGYLMLNVMAHDLGVTLEIEGEKS